MNFTNTEKEKNSRKARKGIPRDIKRASAACAAAAPGDPVRYEDIMYSVPAKLRSRRKETRKIRFPQALLCYLLVMAVYYLFTPLFYYYICRDMMVLNIVDQLVFLTGSVLFAVLYRADLREVFPVRKPKLPALAGVLVILAGSYLMSDVVSVITMYIAPEEVTALSEDMEQSLSAWGMMGEFLFVTIVPAICEEALHRGVILNGLRNTFRNRWTVILLSGAIFGMFHIYPVRWAAPAILGCVMAWLVLETGNMLYSCMLHFGYNGLITLVGYVYEAIDAAEGYAPTAADYTVTLQDVGFYLTWYGVWIPLLFYAGAYLVKLAESPRRPSLLEVGKERQSLLKIFMPAFIILALGIFCLFR